MSASKLCTASSICARWSASASACLLLLACITSCARAPARNANEFEFSIARAPAPSESERYCAWYGSRRGDVLFFGQAAFWSGYHAAGGEPTADLALRGPRLIGRFDLAREELLAPLDAGDGEARSGVWDVLAHPNGRVYFTTYFENAGYVDPANGRLSLFPELGLGLNEISLGPGRNLLASRYGRPGGGEGSVLLFDPDGRPLREYALPAPEGFILAPKTVAYDPVADEIWATTDKLLQAGATEDGLTPTVAGHPTLILEESDGRVRARITDEPGVPSSPDGTVAGEVQFVHFEANGLGYAAVVEGKRLVLYELPPTQAERTLAKARRILLDAHFPRDFDFVQDLQVASDGRVVITRWSGEIHLLTPSGEVRNVTFPRPGAGGLYYTAVARGGRVCATYCADVTVVCGPAP